MKPIRTSFKRLVQRRSGQLEVSFDEQPKPVSKSDFDKGLQGLLSVPPPPKDKSKVDKGPAEDDEETEPLK